MPCEDRVMYISNCDSRAGILGRVGGGWWVGEDLVQFVQTEKIQVSDRKLSIYKSN